MKYLYLTVLAWFSWMGVTHACVWWDSSEVIEAILYLIAMPYFLSSFVWIYFFLGLKKYWFAEKEKKSLRFIVNSVILFVISYIVSVTIRWAFFSTLC